MVKAISRTRNCTTARSRASTDEISRRPTPGQANTVSVTIEPEIRAPMFRPRIVTTGMAAFGTACRMTRRNGPAPLAAAVSMNGLDNASSMDDRVKRASAPAVASPSVAAGMTRWSRPPQPELGSHRRYSENKRISRMPKKKFGMAKPNTEKAMISRSDNRFRRKAAMMPNGTPTKSASASAVPPRIKVAGIRWPTTTVTGRPSR